MRGNKRDARTVRVMLHFTADGQFAAGIVTSRWQGASRLDTRLARLRPLPHPGTPPQHVDPDVWAAYCALGDIVWEHRDALGGTSL